MKNRALNRLYSHRVVSSPSILQGVKKIIFILLFLFLLPVQSTLHAQDYDLTYEQLTIKDGLSQSSVFKIMQDSRGFLWFATQDGLNRYDGYQFRIFYRKEKLDSTSISNTWINWIAEDKDGYLWIGTSGGGLNRYDPRTELFEHYMHDPNNPKSLGNDRVLTVFIDSHNNVWVGTDGGGLNKFNRQDKTFTVYKNSPSEPGSLSHNSVSSICEDHEGNLWIGTIGGGVNKFDESSGQFIHYLHNPDDPTSLSSNEVTVIFEDNRNKLWIGTKQGINIYNRQKETFQRILSDPQNPNSISNNYVRTIAQDDHGYIWVGFYGGLNRYNPKTKRFDALQKNPFDKSGWDNQIVWDIIEDDSGILWLGTNNGIVKISRTKFIHLKNDPDNPRSLSNDFIWAIYEDSDGAIWIGTHGGGLNKFNRTSGLFHQYLPEENKNSIAGKRVLSIVEDHRGYLWLGLMGKGLSRFNRKKQIFKNYIFDWQENGTPGINNIWSLLEDKHKRLWVGTDAGLYLFDEKNKQLQPFSDGDVNGLNNVRIRSLFMDRSGNIWVGTYGNGLNLIDHQTMAITNFSYDKHDSLSLSNNYVRTIWEDKSGTIWVGTSGGLNKFLGKDSGFIHYSDKDGLPNNVIYGILNDNEGNLWLSTNKGLSKFNPQSVKFTNFDVRDGLQSNEFNLGAYCRTRDGYMFFGGVNGFNIFRPSDLRPSTFVPPVFITEFKKFDKIVKFDKSITFVKEITLSYKENFISFEFAALDYTNPEKLKYKYMLEGFDQNWNASGNRRYANYTNLRGGEYTFRVQATNADGLWNGKGAALKITITPPFWELWWFQLLAALFIITLIYTVYRMRVHSIHKQREMLQEQVEERTHELKERNRQITAAKKETDDILNNIEEGIFLLNPQLKIESQYSKALEKIFETKPLANKDFLELLKDKIPIKYLSETEEFLEIMFKNEVDEGAISNLNPLSEVEVHFSNSPDAASSSKFLTFKFRRIVEKDKIKHLIVTVVDISNQISLAKKLEESHIRTKRQMDWLVSILHIEPELLKEFIEGAYLEINRIDFILKHETERKEYKDILQDIYRSIHLIKSNASLLDLKFISSKAHQAEEIIKELLKKKQILGSDFVSIVIQFSELKENLNEINELVHRISLTRKHFNPEKNNEILIRSTKNLIDNLKHQLGKDVKFEYKNFNTTVIPYRYNLLVKDVLVQMARNSLVHGIEPPKERQKKNKPTQGLIEIATERTDHKLVLKFKDDGRGIQSEKLIQKAIKTHKIKPTEITTKDKEKISNLIFLEGITTADKADLNAGQGIGMDIVQQKVKRHGGNIKVDFSEDKYCEFSVILPLKDEDIELTDQEEG